jgi:hypothetical protein
MFFAEEIHCKDLMRKPYEHKNRPTMFSSYLFVYEYSTAHLLSHYREDYSAQGMQGWGGAGWRILKKIMLNRFLCE